jgi:hypothetical protein
MTVSTVSALRFAAALIFTLGLLIAALLAGDPGGPDIDWLAPAEDLTGDDVDQAYDDARAVNAEQGSAR